MAVAAVPGAGADKDAAYKPIRTVVAVRRTSIRVIRIVAICADRSRADVARANPDTNRKLGVCGGREQQEKSKCRKQF
jgi:hypothetical protein